MDSYASAHGLFNQASPSSPLMESTGSAERDVRQKIAIWAHEAGVPARAFENEYFKKFIKALGELGPGIHYQLPTAEELRTTLLTKEVERIKKRLKKHEVEWTKSGCSIIIDMWATKRKTTIMNLCVNSRLGTVFLSTKDVPHTTQHIYKYIESCIQEVGSENVVQIVTNNFSEKTESQKLLNEKKPTVFWTSCATNTINLMLEDITDLPMFKKVLDQAKALTVFIYSHHKTLTLMRNFTKKRDIVRQGVTKSASTFLTLQILLKKKTEIQNMFSSMELEEFEYSKVHGKFVYEIVQETGFWENVALCLKVFSPLIKVLRMVDIDKKPSMGFVYGEIMNARKAIRDVLGDCEKDYELIMDIISSNMRGKLDSCLHLTAYLLNPYYHYKDCSLQHDGEVMDAVLEFFDTIFHGDLEMQHQIINVELPKYKNKEGAFGRELAAKACEVNDDDFDPGNWWGTFGGSTPELRKIAMRVLSLTTSSSGCDRNRHTLKRAHMKKVNELTTTQMNNYIFVQFNLNLKSKYKKNKQMNMEVLLASDAKEAQEWLVDDDDDDDDDKVELEMLWEADEVDYESDGVHIMEEYGDVDII